MSSIMTKTTKTKGAAPRVAEQILEGLREALAFERGERTDVRVDKVLVTARHATAKAPPSFQRSRIIDLRRKKMGVSQSVFASALNVSPETVRAWEQGRNSPGGPALRLLEIAEESPGLILNKLTVVSMKYHRPKERLTLFGGSAPGSTAHKAVTAKRLVASRKLLKATRKK
jgi:putative transcriptional regulator